MKTPDHISKKRQELSVKLSHWKAQLNSLGNTFLIKDNEEVNNKVSFCKNQMKAIYLEFNKLRRHRHEGGNSPIIAN